MIRVMKSALLVIIVTITGFIVTACKKEETSYVQDVINEAMKMDRNELYAKAIEELDGKTMSAVGNSSRGKTAQEYFLAYLQGKEFIDGEYVVSSKIREEFPNYKENFKGTINWTQPKNNMIFAQIASDVKGSNHTLSMTLIQDANQIQTKMLDEKLLLNYIPKEWNGDKVANGEPFALQSLNKVFMFNNTGTKEFKNAWHFVREGNRPQFMGLDSEPVGKNFLYMLTQEKYSNIMKDAFNKLTATEQAYFKPIVDSMEVDAKDLGFKHDSVVYSLAWIKLWASQFNQQTDDGPISVNLVKKDSVDQSGLLVYSKLRSITETDDSSKNNITVAAYQDDYEGIGGFIYKHHLQILKTSPFPWTSAAFIHFMTTTKDGFSPWGKDIGGYGSDNAVNQDHSKDGMDPNDPTKVLFAALNDRGYDWWTTTGKLVVEEPTYLASVSYTMGDWIDLIEKVK